MKEYSITYRSDDLCWSSTPYLNVNEYLWNSPKNVSMRAQICYDENALYVHMEAKEEHHRIWAELKENNPRLYYRLRYTTISGLTNLPGRLGKRVTVDGYRIAKKIYKFQ